MLEDIKTKSMDYTTIGLPQLTGAYEELIPLLDKCLVEGFNIQYPVQAVIVDEVLTLTFNNAHGYTTRSVINFYNTDSIWTERSFRVYSVTSNTLTILLDENFTVAPTISVETYVKHAPLGYTKKFEKQGEAVYSSDNWDGCLKIIDSMDPLWTSTYARFARLQVSHDYSDIDTPIGTCYPFANNFKISQNTSGVPYGAYYRIYLSRTNATSAAETVAVPSNSQRRWWLFGDDSGFYFFNIPSSIANNEYMQYAYIGTFDPFTLATTAITKRSVLILSSYKASVATTSYSLATNNAFLKSLDDTVSANGTILTPYGYENWFVFAPLSKAPGQTISGSSNKLETYSLSLNREDLVSDINVVLVTTSFFDLLGKARGIKWCLSNLRSTERDESSYQNYRYKRSFNSEPSLITAERSGYMYVDLVKDW